MDAVLLMTKAEADREFNKKTPRELTKVFCDGIAYQLKKEGGVIRVDSVTKIINAESYNNTCILRFEVHKEGVAKMLAKESASSLDAALKILGKPETSKTMLENTQNQNINAYCNIPIYRSVFEHGVDFKHLMGYDTGAIIGSYSLTAEVCNKVKGIDPVVIGSDTINDKNPLKLDTPQRPRIQNKIIKENTSMAEIILGVLLIMIIAYLTLGGTKQKENKSQDSEHDKNKPIETTEPTLLSKVDSEEKGSRDKKLTEVSAQSLSSKANSKEQESKKSNDMVTIGVIFLCILLVFVFYNFRLNVSIEFIIGESLLPSLFLSVVGFYIYKGVVVFVGELKRNE